MAEPTADRFDVRGLLALVSSQRLSRHPRRHLEILRTVRRYKLHHAALELLSPSPVGENGATPPVAVGVDHAENVARALEELGPFFIKLGQLLSTRPDLLPPTYITALSRLRDHITPVPVDQVIETIERELGVPLADVFRSFDRQPLGVASTAQTHRAQLLDGTEVVVKVQRPGVRAQTERDVVVLHEMVRVAKRFLRRGVMSGVEQVLREMEESVLADLNYTMELENAERISRQIQGFERLVTPRFFRQYSTDRVLTQSFIRGRPLATLSRDEIAALDGGAVATDLLSAYLKQIVVDGIFHADPHPGNILITDDGRLALFDFGMVGRFDASEKDSIILLLLAFAARQGQRVCDVYLDMVQVPEHLDLLDFQREVSGFVSRYHDMSGGQMGLGSAMLELLRLADRMTIPVPASLTLVAKAMFNLDGIISTLSPHLNPVELIREYMRTIMQLRMKEEALSAGRFAWVVDTWRLVEHAPRDLDAILGKLARDRLTFRVQLDSLDATMSVARLAKSIVTGSIVVGTAYVLGALLGRRRRAGS
ncbi:MAG TPA: AarF/UbiB family protein [bacterium]